MSIKTHTRGFTIVEMLVVIVVVGILATLVVVGYGRWQEGLAREVVKNDLTQLAAAMESSRNFNNGYPASIPSNFNASDGVQMTYAYGDEKEYCVNAASKEYESLQFYVTSENKDVQEGSCSGGGPTITGGAYIQTITDANCPATRTRVVDARDSHTYWVRKLADGRCWMLTNLAYGGGGNNTYGDVKVLSNGGGSSASYTTPRYYIPPASNNHTLEPNNPSTSTNGTGQYGYLYNWCAAMGGQTSSSACQESTAPLPDTSVSVCPAGWILPTGGSGGDFTELNDSINNSATNTSAGLRSNWLAQYGGGWNSSSGGFFNQGTAGAYISSSQNDASFVHIISLGGSIVDPATYNWKSSGHSVRCVASYY